MLLRLQHARESLSDEITFEVCRRLCGWCTSGDGKHVDKFKNEETREGASEVADTIPIVSIRRYLTATRRKSDLRGKQGHISTADGRISNFGMEGRDGDEHDGAHESTEDVFDNDQQEVRRGSTSGSREDHDCELSKGGSDQATYESPAPQTHGGVLLAPFASIVAERDFKGKVDEDGEGEIFLGKALVEELEIGDGVVCLEANFGNEMDDDEGLNVLELEDFTHDLVDLDDAVLFLGLVFFLHESETEGDDNVGPAPEGEVSSKSKKAGIERSGAEPFVCKVLGGESEEHSVRKELAGCQTDGLGCAGVGEVRRGKQCKCPSWVVSAFLFTVSCFKVGLPHTINGDILCGAHKDQTKPPSSETPDS